MQVAGRIQTERRRDPELPSGAVEQVRAPDDVGDALPRVVDYDGELVGVDPVPAPDDRVADRRRLHGVRPLQAVGEGEWGVRQAQAPGDVPARIDSCIATGARIGTMAHLAAAAAAGVEQPSRQQVAEGRVVGREPR